MLAILENISNTFSSLFFERPQAGKKNPDISEKVYNFLFLL